MPAPQKLTLETTLPHPFVATPPRPTATFPIAFAMPPPLPPSKISRREWGGAYVVLMVRKMSVLGKRCCAILSIIGSEGGEVGRGGLGDGVG